MVGYDCISVHPPTLPTKAYIHARTQVWKTSPFRGLGGVFIRCIGSSTHFVKTRIIVSDLREISVHIVRATYSTNRLYVLAKGKPGWKHVDTCKICTLFLHFRGLMPQKLPPFLDFANSGLLLKKYPLFRGNGYEHGCTLWSRVAGSSRLKVPRIVEPVSVYMSFTYHYI